MVTIFEFSRKLPSKWVPTWYGSYYYVQSLSTVVSHKKDITCAFIFIFQFLCHSYKLKSYEFYTFTSGAYLGFGPTPPQDSKYYFRYTTKAEKKCGTNRFTPPPPPTTITNYAPWFTWTSVLIASCYTRHSISLSSLNEHFVFFLWSYINVNEH